MIAIGPAREEDVPGLARLYGASVRALAPEHYAPDAVEAWAAFSDDPGFRDFILNADTLVAEDATGLVGFGGVEGSGRIASLYVRSDRARQGIGAQLLEALLLRPERPMRFWTEASALSRPLFESFGFTLAETEVVERRGARVERYLMERGTGKVKEER